MENNPNKGPSNEPCNVQLANVMVVVHEPPQTDSHQQDEEEDLLILLTDDDQGEETSTRIPLSPVIERLTPVEQRLRPTKHLNTNRKLWDWNLTVTKKWLIIDDPNLSRIEEHHVSDLQINSYPGATFAHVVNIMAKTILNTKVEKVILAFFIYHRGQPIDKMTTKQLQNAINKPSETFMTTQIWIPLINYSKTLT